MTSSSKPQPGRVATADLLISANRTLPQRAAVAWADLAKTASLWQLVWALSVFDIRLRYRGSVLGPFWLTLSTAVMVAALGVLYSQLFHIALTEYLPFISLSLVLWTFMSTIVGEGCLCFTSQDSGLRAMRMPLALHAARVVIRNLFVLGHNIIVIVLVFLIMRQMPGRFIFLEIPAFSLWLIDGFAACLILGVLCARFRDVPPIVASLMQVAFFISPVIWSPALMQHRGRIFLETWNPFFDLLDIIRGPLLNTSISGTIWMVACLYSVLLVMAAGIIFVQFRPRVSYWI